jgi:sugar phosphate permease
MSLCTATLVPIMVFLFHHLGIANGYAACGCGLILIGILAIFWVRNTPEEVGVSPDNEPVSRQQLANGLAEYANHKSPFTIPVLLRDRDMWLISIGFGVLWLVDIGVVSQLVPRLISVGYEQNTAIWMFTTAAFFCAIFSYVWGWLDVRFGTRRTSIVYAFFFVVTHACLLVRGSDAFTYFTLLLVGMSIAGIKELATSQVGSVYGRYDFAAANRVISTIACLFRVCCFAVIAASLKWTGDYDAAYMFFILLDLVGAGLIYFITDTCKGKVDAPQRA